jgi:hypothetical protein
MGDAIERARAARNVLERLGRKIPGIAGYLDRELTREIDQLVRGHLAESLDAARGRVAEYARTLDLASAGKLERVATLDKDLDALANAVRHAGSGYAGLFDAEKVGREQLEAAYRLDMSLVEGVEAVAEETDRLSQSEDALDRLSEALASLRARFEGRGRAAKGIFA